MNEPAPGLTSSPRRRGGRPPRWSIDDIEDAALRLIDAEGLEALSMRRLADELGTAFATLYGYVRTKEEILDGVAARVFREIDLDIDPSSSWEAQLSGVLGGLHTAIKNHPGVAELLAAPRSLSDATIDDVRETLLGILRRTGLGVGEAVDVITMMISYVVGFTVIEESRERRASPDEQLSRLSHLSPARYPYLSEAAGHWAGRTSARSFEFGIAHLIDSVRNGEMGLST